MPAASSRFASLSPAPRRLRRPAAAGPHVELSPGPDTVSTGYAEIADAEWLGGDRWAVVAPLDVTVGIAGSRRPPGGPAGRRGTKEIRNPSIVFLAGDTLYVGDWGLRRVSLWTSGRPVRQGGSRYPRALAARCREARDDAGRWYLELKPAARRRRQRQPRLRAVVVRQRRASSACDTVGPAGAARHRRGDGRRRAPVRAPGVQRHRPLGRAARRIGLGGAGVREPGGLARHPTASGLEAKPLPDRVLEVTRYDRELFSGSFRPSCAATAEQLPFAAMKPPFEAGFTVAGRPGLAGEEPRPGRLLAPLSRGGPAGRLVREIRVPGQGRILAVGPRRRAGGRAAPTDPAPRST